MQVYSTNLAQVVDIVVSHQGVEIKTQLIGQLMSALVLPAPEHYRPLLRRLAALSECCACPPRCMMSAVKHMHCSQSFPAVTCRVTPFFLRMAATRKDFTEVEGSRVDLRLKAGLVSCVHCTAVGMWCKSALTRGALPLCRQRQR